MILNIDLHTHTSRHSSCSVLSPQALCEIALERGLNALAITEHHHQWSKPALAALQERYPSLKLYAGIEVSCSDGHDYVVLGLQEAHRARYGMSYWELRALVAASPGAYVFIAHCFRHSSSEEGLARREVDGIEVASYNVLARPQPPSGPAEIVRAELYQKWREKMGWAGLYNSDGHSRTMVGTFYSQIDAPQGAPADELALAALLRRAEIRGIENTALIRRAINGDPSWRERPSGRTLYL
jgi:predicted metal-dependent phosphoesterase TrpH